MNESSYTVERTIEDVEFDQPTVGEVRSSVKHDMVDEGHDDLDESEIESRVRERLVKHLGVKPVTAVSLCLPQLVDIARDRTMYEQGDNRLHTDINHTLTVEE